MVFVHKAPAGSIHVGGSKATAPYYRVSVTVPAGTRLHGPSPFALQRRKDLVREVTNIVLEAEGTEQGKAEAWRVWCVITEVQDSFWGLVGEVARFEDIVAFASSALGDTPVGTRLREAHDCLPVPELTAASTS